MSAEVTTLRHQLQQLAQLHADGALADETYRESRATLERRLVDAVMAGGGEGAPPVGSRKSARLWAWLTAVAMVAGAGGYAAFQAAWQPSAPLRGLASGDASMEATSPPANEVDAPNAGTLSGRVSLAPELAKGAAPGDTVFIFARAAGGAGVPLAVLRKQVKDLPLDFTLDDSLAMVPASRLSNVSRAVVTARVSKSGDAIPQPGDLSGRSAEVPMGTNDLRIVIDTVVRH